MKLTSYLIRIFSGFVFTLLVVNFLAWLLITDVDSTLPPSNTSNSALVFGLSTTILILFSYLWLKYWTKPIANIASQILGIRRGQFENRISGDNFVSSEVMQIIDGINRMASRLQKLDSAYVTQSQDMSTLLSSLREGLVAIDSDLKIRFINPRALKILGFKESSKAPEILQEGFRNYEALKFVRDSINDEAPYMMELNFVDDSGRTKIFQLRSQPYKIDDKQKGVILLLLDISQLRQLESYRKDFVSNVSHELRTPLTALKGFSETLCEVPPEKIDDIRKFSKIIFDHTERLAALVEDLLTLSKMESQSPAQIKEQLQLTQLSSLIPHAISICQTKAVHKGITIESTVNDDIEKLVIPHLFEQALINLIDNAINYSPEGSKVTVVLDAQDSKARLHVIDNGPGIEARHLPRLFERFYRVDEGRDRLKGGTGIGLALVKHIAQIHGGQVTVSSVVGSGSHFILELK